MKIIILITLIFSSVAYSYPLTKNTNCQVNYYEFCKSVGKQYKNMCPKEIKNSMKKMCIVNDISKGDILNYCKDDILTNCSKEDKDDFKAIYYCLTNPKKWANFRRECLSSLAKTTHSSHSHKGL